MPFGRRHLRVESFPVVAHPKLNAVLHFVQRDPDVLSLAVLEGIHRSLPSDLVDQELNRWGESDVNEVRADSCGAPKADLVGEALSSFGQAGAPDGRPVEIADQGPDRIGRLILRLENPIQVFVDAYEVARARRLLAISAWSVRRNSIWAKSSWR